MTFAKHLLLAIVYSGSVHAQHLSRSLVASPDDIPLSPRSFIVTADTVRVLAVMVQFQVDNDNRTTGNGQFDLSTPSSPGLDSPPRNAQYFRDHLTFLENYYRKSSKGKLIVRTTLVDSVYTLASQMEQYSPRRNEGNQRVGQLARDTWVAVDNSGRVPDFSLYDCFIIFHAGAGRDIDLVGTIGYDPTPFDIPSLYMGLRAFRTFFGQDFSGFQVRGGFRITNTIVMPETESREIPATPANLQLTLGINGLLVASVGNFLGLPDLFDTNTGRSGIGRFGLMDGQAIFSFAGAFPPEPSAWEKFWLGWVQPILLGAGEQTIALPAVSHADTIYRIPISGSEYFLLENRNRDAAGNGQGVTTRYAGTVRQQRFTRDTTGFTGFDVSALVGNVIDVEDLDWSLPGGVSREGEFFDGGALIWHIDESVIVNTLGPNTVNANPTRRGVDLEEADGSQDIGQQYGQFDPGSGSEEGTALDFWYQGNSSPVNRNEFSATTHPNSASNSGGKSHITIKDFSRRGPRMTARVIVGGDVTLLSGYPKSLPNQTTRSSLTVVQISNAPALFVPTTATPAQKPVPVTGVPSRLYAFTSNGAGLLRADGVFAEPARTGFAYSGPVAAYGAQPQLAAPSISTQSGNSVLQGLLPQPRPSDSLAIEQFSAPADRLFSTAPIARNLVMAIGGERGVLYQTGTALGVLDSSARLPGEQTVAGLALRPGEAGYWATTASGGVTYFFQATGIRFLGAPIAVPPVAGLFAGEEHVAAATNSGELYLLRTDLSTAPGFPVRVSEPVTNPLALADIDGDGSREIILFSGNTIHAFNHAGASIDNFPKRIPSSKPITSNPVVADLDGDGNVEIVGVSADGLVVAYDKRGVLARGFPLQAGIGDQSVAAFTMQQQTGTVAIGLAVVSSTDGTVSAWRTGTAANQQSVKMPWPQYQRDAQHSGLSAETIDGAPLSREFFPKDRVYNWPNPVYDGRTFLRYYLKEPATVRIKILDLAGDLVTEFAGPGIGGVDNEIEWKVGNVQSGIYLARIEATSSGRSETAIVKVAIVK